MRLKLLAVPFLVVMITAVNQKIFADFVAGTSLGAQAIVTQFNQSNGGKGIAFNDWFSVDDGVYPLVFQANPVMDFDLYANQYKGSDGSWIMWGIAGGSISDKDRTIVTFCVEPEYNASLGLNWGKLNYSQSRSQVNPTGKPLTVGAAYLYAQYVLGNLPQDIQGQHKNIGDAVRYIMGYTNPGTDHIGNLATEGWNNDILQYLSSVNSDQDFWKNVYNPDAYYDEIGNYSVFVMNVFTDNNGNNQDFLYLAKAHDPYDPGTSGVPEPATMVFWALGTLGIAGYSRRRSKIF